MTTLDTITTNTITRLLDEAARELADVPGRTPQDSQIAGTLLHLAVAGIQGHDTPSRLLLNTLARRGVSGAEAEAVALALAGLALRLGAWLGRGENMPHGCTGRLRTHEDRRAR